MVNSYYSHGLLCRRTDTPPLRIIMDVITAFTPHVTTHPRCQRRQSLVVCKSLVTSQVGRGRNDRTLLYLGSEVFLFRPTWGFYLLIRFRLNPMRPLLVFNRNALVAVFQFMEMKGRFSALTSQRQTSYIQEYCFQVEFCLLYCRNSTPECFHCNRFS